MIMIFLQLLEVGRDTVMPRRFLLFEAVIFGAGRRWVEDTQRQHAKDTEVPLSESSHYLRR